MIILKHFVQQKRKREKKDGAGWGGVGGRSGEEKGIGFEKMEVEERGLKKRGAFDLKSRPRGNRGGVTHSNTPPPPLPLFQELQNGMKNGENKESRERERESVGVCVCVCLAEWSLGRCAHACVCLCNESVCAIVLKNS